MDFEYGSSKVEYYFSNFDKLIQKCGKDIAKMILQRLIEIRAYPSMRDLMNGIGKPHRLRANLSNCIAFHLDKRFRLIVELPQHNENEFFNIKKVVIKGVSDYHDGKDKWVIS